MFVRELALLVVLGCIYFVFGKIGLAFASINPSTSAIWPPTGIAIATLLIFGVHRWPAILAGAFLVNITTAGSILGATGIATGNTLEAIIATTLVNRYAKGMYAFERPRNVVWFTVLAGMVAPLLSATIGTLTLAYTGQLPMSLYAQAWLTWWFGDMGGAVVLAPFILLWYTHPGIQINLKKTGEFILLFIFFIFICYLVFSGMFPFPYFFILPLIWSAFRFDLRETATLILILAIISVRTTMQGVGPFVTDTISINQAFLRLQIFMIIVSVTKLTVSSVVTDRSKANRNLAIREQLFKALIEKSNDVVVLVDITSLVSYISPSVQKLLGYAPTEVIGKVGFSFIHPDDRKMAEHDLLRVLKNPNDAIVAQYRMRKKDGSWLWVETTGRNLLMNPAVGAVVINFRDITERKELEAAKDDFLMTASHQLRAPLTAMRWNLESMFGHEIPKGCKGKLESMYANNQQMIKAVNELLDIAHIIQGKLPNTPEEFDLVARIKKQIAENEDFSKRKKITVTFAADRPKIPVYIDPKHAIDVINNLISNAIKYSENGSTITIGVLTTGDTATMTITDAGIGIPPAEQGKLFTKFFRASNAREVDAQGTGLGLFIVKSYVEGWGGTVHLTSPVTNKKGTKIAITIPIKKGGKI